jgi:hypothetical protein
MNQHWLGIMGLLILTPFGLMGESKAFLTAQAQYEDAKTAIEQDEAALKRADRMRQDQRQEGAVARPKRVSPKPRVKGRVYRHIKHITLTGAELMRESDQKTLTAPYGSVACNLVC